MKKIFTILLTVIVIALLAFSAVGIMRYMGYSTTPESSLGATQVSGELKGFFVDTLNSREFPLAEEKEQRQLRQELDEMVDFASRNGFNAIFFEARPDRTSLYHSKYFPTSTSLKGKDGFFSFFQRFDALDYLCGSASTKNIAVYAVVNPYYSGTAEYSGPSSRPALKDALIKTVDGVRYFDPALPETATLLGNEAGELAAKYPIAGIIYRGLDNKALAAADPAYLEKVEQLLSLCASRVKAADPKKELGVVTQGVPDKDGFLLSPETVGQWVQKGSADLIIPLMDAPVDGSGLDYHALMQSWSATAQRDGTAVFTGNPAYVMSGDRDGLPFEDVHQLGYQLFINTQFPAVGGAVFESYTDLTRNTQQTESLMSYLWSAPTKLPELDFNFPQTLTTTPDTATTVSSDTTRYYITGTSDPAKALSMDGKSIERKADNGVFGVLVPLEYGRNEFVFTQEGAKTTVVLTRPKPSEVPNKITKITQSSIFPTFSYPVENNQTLTVKCVGPAGAKITAQVGSLSVSLKQVAAATSGIPATYSAELMVTGYDDNLVTDLGPISYTLNYGGTITTYKSAGALFVKGKNALLALETTQPMTGFYTNETSIVNFITDVKAGAVDTIQKVGSSRYLTGTGGYVDFKSSKIISGKVNVNNSVSRIEYEKDEKAEQYTLKGTNLPVYKLKRTDTGLDVTLFNTTFEIEDLSYIQSDLFAKVELERLENGVVLHFTSHPGVPFWGYDIGFHEKDTVLYIKKLPQTTGEFSRPLKGVTIMLDPGHGGTDPGALGAAGKNGPVEAKMNLAVSYMAKYRLEQLGATVTMTRADDSTVALFDRHFFAVEQRPDFYVSIHHNSTSLLTDANNVSGLEVYYLEPGSEGFAQSIADAMRSRLDRKVQDPKLNAFYVTRQTFCPAILLEVSYISNPAEQVRSCSSIEIFKTACGLADAIVNSVTFS